MIKSLEEFKKETIVVVSVECDHVVNGEFSEYENMEDAFIFWANVSCTINNVEYSGAIQPDCGVRELSFEWDTSSKELSNADDNRGILEIAGEKLSTYMSETIKAAS